MLIRINDRTGVFAPQYFGSTAYYACMAAYKHAVVDASVRYDKRFKSIHRCTIVDTRAELMLTVPVCRPGALQGSRRMWRDMEVSAHAQWWADHRVSLESAYGRTPFFEYYIDRFMPWLRYRDMSIVDFDLELDREVRRILGMDTQVSYTTEGIDPANFDDYRSGRFGPVAPVEYYQVRGRQLGFHANLSILDLIFNMGPEAPLVLRRMWQLQ